ncbi:NifU family protein [Ornithobacterium rhinotracheale]|uniref:NifU family protein n=1 Tax=Ornithobacterium rhinotracheale TaxID=28251 RepID=A0A410JUR1_ORNRH|nr:NifU family protein [Ornithobacterium rhinotracheale]QAR31768.1 NifU family protein [Ornithobacterium rhinotracheale]
MRVYIEQTPQKNIMKFVCDKILTSGSYEYTTEDTILNSPMAKQLFLFPFVRRVFITANFVAIQKMEDIDWENIAQELKELINEHLENSTIIIEKAKKVPYTLYAEMTPNPNVMKFVANQEITPQIVEVKSREEATQVPVAVELYENFDFVKEVFLQENFLSVTADHKVDWQIKALEIREFLLNYLQSGKTIVKSDYTAPKNEWEEHLEQKVYSGTEKEIQRVLDQYIQPAVANDGGNIALISFDESTKTAKMLLQGACSGCPSSTITLKNGIEAMLKEMLPNVVEHVEAING